MKWIVIFCSLVAGVSSLTAAADRQQPTVFEQTVCRDVALRHLVYLPEEYGEDSARDWPLILFLHGAGERGSELDRVRVNGLPKELGAGREIPAIVLSPQCPAGTRWESELMVETLDALLDDALVRYRVDPRRIYVTGLSMGGFGAWALAASHPERFAAVVPVCGGGNPDMAIRLRRLPIWAFHGARDDVVPIAAMEQMVDAMARVHGDMRTTVYPDAGHDSWSATYANPELYTWLLGQTKPEPRQVSLEYATATASSGDPSKAIDGDPATRWESEWSDPQWLQIDLGASTPLRRMVLYWETAYGEVYEVLASDKGGRDWKTITSVVDGDGAVDLVEFPAGFSARFLKLVMTARGTQWGDSIWELELEMEPDLVESDVELEASGASPELQAGTQDPAPLIRFGTMRETLGQGLDQARVALADVVGQRHVYAVGALEGIAGEITILDSVIYATSAGASATAAGAAATSTTAETTETAGTAGTAATAGDLVPLDGSSLSATMLVGQSVAVWQESPVETPIPPTAFDAAIRDAGTVRGLDPSVPFAFVVEGTLIDVCLHVVHGACPVHARRNGLELAEDERPYEMEIPRIEGSVVGVYADDAAGELTHPGTRVHAHLVFADPETGERVTGHLERVGVAAGSVIRVPQAR